MKKESADNERRTENELNNHSLPKQEDIEGEAAGTVVGGFGRTAGDSGQDRGDSG